MIHSAPPPPKKKPRWQNPIRCSSSLLLLVVLPSHIDVRVVSIDRVAFNKSAPTPGIVSQRTGRKRDASPVVQSHAGFTENG